MKKGVTFLLYLGIIAITLNGIHCSKEYSYEGGKSAGTARYTFDGAGGACTGAVVNGKYYSGVSMTTANTIQLRVNVTTTGSYILNTNTADGFYFTASGTFTNTGVQFITLNGAGQPSTTGSFNFATSAASSCSFNVVVEKQVAIFTLAGTPDNCTGAVITGNYIAGKNLTVGNTVDLKVIVTAPGAYSLNTDTLDGISFSQTGIFTLTGLQSVTLTGSGNPVIPGNLAFHPMAGLSGCDFKLSVLTPEPLATYVLESGGGGNTPCISAVSGNYVNNAPLTTANYVSIKVFITVPGNYCISTNTVNGMMFSHTGTFTTTGSKDVILESVGKPVLPGTYQFTPEIVGPHPLGGQACTFTVIIN